MVTQLSPDTLVTPAAARPAIAVIVVTQDQAYLAIPDIRVPVLVVTVVIQAVQDIRDTALPAGIVVTQDQGHLVIQDTPVPVPLVTPGIPARQEPA